MAARNTGNRTTEDIRRLVRFTEQGEGLGPVDPKAEIPGTRGVGYMDATGSAASVSGDPDETEAPEDNDGETAGAETSGAIDATDPQSGITDFSDGSFDADDIINNTDGPTLNGTTNPLKNLELEDCADPTKAIDIRLDGIFPPIAATTDENGFVITDVWTDGNTPPVLIGYTAGKYGTQTGLDAGATQSTTAIAAVEVGIVAQNGLSSPPAGDTAGTYRLKNMNPGGSGSYSPEIEVDNVGAGGTRVFSITAADLVDCIVAPPSNPSSCPVTAPTETGWPEGTNSVRLLKDGVFTSSLFDTEIDQTDRAPSGQIDGCTEAGSFVSIIPINDGGFLIGKTDTKGGTFSTTHSPRVYDSDGFVTDVIASTAVANYIIRASNE